jgi:hypothetical protein
MVVLISLEIKLHGVSDGDNGNILLFQKLQSTSGIRLAPVDAVNLDAMTVFLVSQTSSPQSAMSKTYQLEVTCRPQFQADRT